MRTTSKFQVVLIVVTIAALLVVGVAYAAIVWTHAWDATTVRSDRGPGANKLFVTGRDAIPGPGGTVVATYDLLCGNEFPRVDTYINGNGLRTKFICAQMTPTPVQ